MNANELRNDWRQLAASIQAASEQLSKCHLDILLAIGKCDADSAERNALMHILEHFDSAQTAILGLAYMATPQTEWMGGDSSNCKLRAPHAIQAWGGSGKL